MIVVIGEAQKTPSFYAVLAKLPNTRVRYCRTELEAISVLRLSPEPCAGILLDSHYTEQGQGNVSLARTLRAVCAEVPILFVRHFQDQGLASANPVPSHCRVERTADGQYLLHCALRNAEWESETDARSGPVDSPWLFEFSAPCKVNR